MLTGHLQVIARATRIHFEYPHAIVSRRGVRLHGTYGNLITEGGRHTGVCYEDHNHDTSHADYAGSGVGVRYRTVE